MKLVGVLLSDDPKQSIAILNVDGANISASEGSALPDGSVVGSIGPQSITLRRAGQESMLEWEMHGASPDASFATLPLAEAGSTDTAISLPVPTQVQPKAPVAEQLSSLRQAAIQTLAARAGRHPRPPR